jgi:hypothetical protein
MVTVGLLASAGLDGVVSIYDRVRIIGLAAFSISLAVNASTTGLIVARIVILSAGSHILPGRGKRVRNAMAVVLESGFLMFAVQLLWVVFFSLHPQNEWFLISGFSTQIYVGLPTV